MQIQELKGKRVAFWGMGKECSSFLPLLRERLQELTPALLNDSPLSDSEMAWTAQNGIAPIICGEEISSALKNFDVIIKSPGVSCYRPEILSAKSLGVIFTSPVSLWFAEHADARTICVTGTKGKSTTSAMIAHLLKCSGLKVALTGNIGNPVWGFDLGFQSYDWWVIELSSYQLSELKISPNVAVLTNLYPEHQDWHRSTQQYYDDKLRLFRYLGPNSRAVINYDFKGRVCLPPAQILYFNCREGFSQRDGWFWSESDRIFPSSGMPFQGEHNFINACAALTVAKLVGVDLVCAQEALRSFIPLPHRLEVLGEREGLIYVDDSISTIPESALAAVRAFSGRPITLLLGGFDRGQEWSELAESLIKVKVHAVITMGQNRALILEALQDAKQSAPDGGSETLLLPSQNLDE
ncbi:MAG: UDP-N-acetylmuramoyl-L-alanine--D-glutamate ligase, partial [Deltaproteobacteria bacterium]|nr:UDP-N-acetylmuramoyl-L-alanine--D-glutamate ligase [Deltaproteobacteria bacterium]